MLHQEHRGREKFARRRMRQRRQIPIVTAAAVLVMLGACEITQEHIDEASERLSQATVASGSYPSATGGRTLQSSDLAGSTWRIVERSSWPKAMSVVTLGSNGRTVWHHHSHSEAWDQWFSEWRVSGGGVFTLDDIQTGSGGANPFSGAGIRVNENNVCIAWGGDACGYVFQRVTP